VSLESGDGRRWIAQARAIRIQLGNDLMQERPERYEVGPQTEAVHLPPEGGRLDAWGAAGSVGRGERLACRTATHHEDPPSDCSTLLIHNTIAQAN
jgi:hypothetical protein